MHKREDWLDGALRRDLAQVEAPGELWDRVQSAPAGGPFEARRPLKMAWALAAVAIAVTIMGALLAARLRAQTGPVVADASRVEFQSCVPAQIRGWASARAGIDVALPDSLPASVRLIGANFVSANSAEPAVRVRYLVGDREAEIIVKKASQPGGLAHSDLRGELPGSSASWVTQGHMYTLKMLGSEDVRAACVLCHG